MYYDLCNGSVTVNPQFPCDENLTEEVMIESEWPLERVVSTLVPVFFGIIGLGGLLGNALVVLGKEFI
jgi:allatostatin receptor